MRFCYQAMLGQFLCPNAHASIAPAKLSDVLAPKVRLHVIMTLRVFEGFPFRRPHYNDRPPFSKVSTFKSVFENLRFRGPPSSIVLVWTSPQSCLLANRPLRIIP